MFPELPCYLFHEDAFIENYRAFENALKSVYPHYKVSYSYKTNYTPYICRLVKKLGGYAEVVSEMEYRLAKRIGYGDEKIIFNGPAKEIHPNCILNVDSIDELKSIGSHRVGLRINLDVGQGFISRFGIDVSDLDEAFAIGGNRISGIHCHISQARSLDAWKMRGEIMLKIADKYFGFSGPEYIDLGSGMFGDMSDELKAQFSEVPTYQEYAECVAGLFATRYPDSGPVLFTEPGTTLVNRYFDFICSVQSIKYIRGKTFVVLNGSKHNIGEICELKNLPLEVIHNGGKIQSLHNAVLCGYTCLEHDVMRKSFDGELAIGDTLIFQNVGGYSIVSKPPFIRPNYPIYAKSGEQFILIKRQETFNDIFKTFEWE